MRVLSRASPSTMSMTRWHAWSCRPHRTHHSSARYGLWQATAPRNMWPSLICYIASEILAVQAQLAPVFVESHDTSKAAASTTAACA
jgi:hypothetical protein